MASGELKAPDEQAPWLGQPSQALALPADSEEGPTQPSLALAGAFTSDMVVVVMMIVTKRRWIRTKQCVFIVVAQCVCERAQDFLRPSESSALCGVVRRREKKKFFVIVACSQQGGSLRPAICPPK
eukprot:scaffold768_cov166-Amphora_coffeaeformis.AAC.11